MSAPLLRLVGTAGMFEGALAVLRPGESVTVGRSRFVSLSAVRTPLALRIGRQKLERNPAFRRLSRRHFEVDYADGENVVLADLSKNGLFVDGARVDRVTIAASTLASQSRVLRFGTNEEIRLELDGAGGD